MNRTESKPFVVACIPAFNEERTIGGVVVRGMKYVDRVVVCDDGSRDLTGEIAGGLVAVLDQYARRSGIVEGEDRSHPVFIHGIDRGIILISEMFILGFWVVGV